MNGGWTGSCVSGCFRMTHLRNEPGLGLIEACAQIPGERPQQTSGMSQSQETAAEKSGLIRMPPGVLRSGIGAHATIKQDHAGTSHERDEETTCKHTADMGPPSYLVTPIDERHKELSGHPRSENPDSGHAQGDDPECQNPDEHARVQDQVGCNGSGNSATCPDQRQTGGRQREGVY